MNKKFVWIVVGIIVLAGVFYGGMVYGKGQTATSANTASIGFAGARTRSAGGTGGFGGATIGQIISKDATSITVSLAAGGSKIIFLDNTTPITKQTNGTLSDLIIGTNVMVTGTANTDGSVSATAVQIRPNVPQDARVQ